MKARHNGKARRTRTVEIAQIDHSHEEASDWRLRLAQAMARVRSDVSFALIDALIVTTAYSAALLLRFFDLQGVPQRWVVDFLLYLPLVVLVHLVSNLAFGAYGHVWEYASVEEAMRLVFAAILASSVVIGGILVYRDVTGQLGFMPLTVAAAGSLLALGGMGAIRFRARLFSFKRIEDLPGRARTLVAGNGRQAAELARHGSTRENPREVVGFVSVEGDTQQRRLAGLPVLGDFSHIAEIVTDLQVDEVVVADRVSDEHLRRLVDDCMDIDVGLRISPGLIENNGNGLLRDIRDLQIDDLLARQSVSADLAGATELLSGKRVVVTGGGGSIGSEMVRQLLEADARVIALDHDETLLHDAMLDWPRAESVETVLCDIREGGELTTTFQALQPELVFHAAALKHVPILEKYPAEAVKTNVLGTANVLSAAQRCGVSRFVLISTDKAVNPGSVLGATKRIAEMLVQSAAVTVYAAVRFGNVLGSRGSVVPTFMKQIRSGGPVTITDPEMTRYFMTVGEAIGLVLQAAALAESGEVFVLDMGEPARIEELARRMIRLAGLVPGRDIEVVFTGPRPGEKKTETLSVKPLEPSRHPKIGVTRPGYPGAVTMHEILETVRREVETGSTDRLVSLLHAASRQEWRPDETLNLVELQEIPTWA
jgi:FlaA1/EpsC-like NDP-sugar epimerase